MAITSIMENYNQQTEEQIAYDAAYKKVKKIKNFYTHLLVYIVVNIMLVIKNVQHLDAGESYFQFENFTVAFFWGIGLLAHAFSTFMPNFIFGQKWEEKKMKEFIENDKKMN
jgi:predicted membrane channel-forming protein YqfA (hemolysin III family)